MACVHEFAIIMNTLEKNRGYGYYNPEEYDYVAIHDDIVCKWIEKLKIMKSYFPCSSRPEFGLAYCGVTIIPPESLDYFYDVVLENTPVKFQTQIAELLSTITEAKNSGKCIVHFGL